MNAMRWENLTAVSHGDPEAPAQAAARAAPPLPLALPNAVVRTFDTPGFAGMTFYEVRAKSIINRVPGASRVPFEWTINPYRGCSHACTYCFARNTHTYLDLDAGADFDSKVIVKVNAGELLRRELAAPKWRGDHIAMGTNVDCYQRAEGRYRLMPRDPGRAARLRQPVLDPHQGHADPARPRPAAPGRRGDAASASRCRSASSTRRCGASVEPGTPSPRRRLDAVRALTDAGFAVGVLMAPDPARAHRHRRVDRRDRGRDRRRRRGQRDADPAAPAPRRPGVVRGLAGPRASRTWCRATGGSTGGARTCRRSTSARSPPGCGWPPAGTASTGPSRARRGRCRPHRQRSGPEQLTLL